MSLALFFFMNLTSIKIFDIIQIKELSSLAQALYSDYTAVKNAADRLYRATIGTYTWRSNVVRGSVMRASDFDEINTVITTAAARVVTVGCGGYHTANYSSANNGYRGDRSYDSYNSYSSRNSYDSGERVY